MPAVASRWLAARTTRNKVERGGRLDAEPHLLKMSETPSVSECIFVGFVAGIRINLPRPTREYAVLWRSLVFVSRHLRTLVPSSQIMVEYLYKRVSHSAHILKHILTIVTASV